MLILSLCAPRSCPATHAMHHTCDDDTHTALAIALKMVVDWFDIESQVGRPVMQRSSGSFVEVRVLCRRACSIASFLQRFICAPKRSLGHMSRQVWEEGSAFREIQRRLDQLQARLWHVMCGM